MRCGNGGNIACVVGLTWTMSWGLHGLCGGHYIESVVPITGELLGLLIAYAESWALHTRCREVHIIYVVVVT